MTDPIATIAREAALLAGAYLRQAFLEANAGATLCIEEKLGHADVVTQVDRQSEATIRDFINGRLAKARIVGEENGTHGEGDTLWYVDPLDGTSNFVAGLPFFCVSVAAFAPDGNPLAGVVYDPMHDELFAASPQGLLVNDVLIPSARRCTEDRNASVLLNLPREGARPSGDETEAHGALLERFRSVRRLGSAALQLAYVAAGRATVGIDRGCGPWDIAAGLQLVRSAGGQIRCSGKAGKPLAEPLRNIEQVHTLLVATAEFDLANSAAQLYLHA